MRAIACAWVLIVIASVGAFVLAADPSPAADPSLTIVRDVGGVSALPYYERLHLRSREESRPGPSELGAPSPPQKPVTPFTEESLLPVVSRALSPGPVASRALHAPGLTPMFLIGEDAQSHTWLHEHAGKLRALHAVGLVVNVTSGDALAKLRAEAPGLTLAPVSGDDLAQRLKLTHYPVLITATGIEQ